MTDRHSFTLYKTPARRSMGYVATLGDYDLDSPTGYGATAADAIIDWLEMWGDTLEGVKPDYAPRGIEHD